MEVFRNRTSVIYQNFIPDNSLDEYIKRVFNNIKKSLMRKNVKFDLELTISKKGLRTFAAESVFFVAGLPLSRVTLSGDLQDIISGMLSQVYRSSFLVIARQNVYNSAHQNSYTV